MRVPACRYHLDRMSLRTLLFVSNFLYLSRPSSRLRALAAPLLAAVRPGRGDAAVGLHVRVGDSALQNGRVRDDQRYPPECDFSQLPDAKHRPGFVAHPVCPV